MSVGCAVFLVGAFVRVGRLRSRRGGFGGFVALGVDSMLDRVRDSNFLVGLTWGEGLELEPGGVWVSDRTGW